MSHNPLFTAAEIAEKLNVGESTLKLWKRRYKNWFPDESGNDDTLFPGDVFERFSIIAEGTATGKSPEEIIEKLENASAETPEPSTEPPVETPLPPRETITPDALSLKSLEPLLKGIIEQQKRIADASERRADAEERKAGALESRAEAEQIKAEAFQGILTVLRENAVQSTVNSLMNKVNQMSAPAPEPLSNFSDNDTFNFPEDLSDLPELTETPVEELKQTPPEAEFDMPDIIPEPAPEPPVSLPPEPEVETLSSEPDPPEDMDDLSLLIDSPSPAPEALPEDMDDLSLLIDAPAAEEIEEPEDMDDLSLLIDAPPPETQPEDMDDLSLLIDTPAGEAIPEPEDMDDLSLLLDPQDKPAAATPPAATPPPTEESPEAYKSKVLSRIIKMKQKDGLSVEETTRIFNEEKLRTLSGKGEWDTTTIAGIYKYIDSVKTP